MGKSEQRNGATDPNGLLPELDWSTKTFTPAEFPANFSKPQVVRLLPGDSEGWEGSFPVPAKRVNLGPELDTSNPFLIYSHRRRTKVFAEHVVWDKKSFKPDGSLLEIPKDYIGWMEVISKDGRGNGHHGSIQSVVATGCKYFLTRTTLNGFNVSEDEENGIQILGERKIYPGEVVKVDKIWSKKWKLVDGTLRGLVKPETQFLLCTDLKKNVVGVSMAHPGMFNPVAQKGLNSDEKVVYLINDVLKVFKLPIYVRLAFGWPPKLAGTEFSGVLKLAEIDKKETLVAYNFTTTKDSMIAEIPADLNIRLQTVENLTEVEDSDGFKYAMEECINSVYPYVVSMKSMEVPYEVVGPPPPTKKRPLSYGRMGRPCNMKNFSRSDIYPPLEEQQMSTLSRLSFKDPERSLKGLYHMDIDSIINEETSTDGSIIQGGGHSRRSSNASSQLSEKFEQQASIDNSADNYPTSETIEREMRDSRAQKMREIMEREAPC